MSVVSPRLYKIAHCKRINSYEARPRRRTAGAQALAIVAAPEFNRDAEILAALATDSGLPTMCEWGHMVGAGPVQSARNCGAAPPITSPAYCAAQLPVSCRSRAGALRVCGELQNRQGARADLSDFRAVACR